LAALFLIYRPGSELTWNFYASTCNCLIVTQVHRSEPMPNDAAQYNIDNRRRTRATWPFPVGSWIVPVFWLIVVLGALILHSFR
jgi:hypothetical protein